MPPRKRDKKGAGAAPAPPEEDRDHISALPDDVLRRVLNLLPAQDAARTCLLARRWRHLWKSATRLRIRGRDDRPVHVKEIREFVYHLLLLRGGAPLGRIEFWFSGFEKEDVPRVNLWFRHAILCKVRSLRLRSRCRSLLELDDVPLVSQHLTSLRLSRVCLRSSFLDFSSCRTLNYLELKDCRVSAVKKISSESLEELSITRCSFSGNSRVRICAPNLSSLEIDDFAGRSPVLETMPKLAYAYVEITRFCKDSCTGANYEDCDCENCDKSDDISCNCVLLQGLCRAEILALSSVSKKFIFKRDLRWCPTFYNLKILLLNDYWCEPDDFRLLACFLLHSPFLNKLALFFSEGPEYKVEIKGRASLVDSSAAISKHLEIVEVNCDVVDEGVLKLLKFLCTFNISFRF